MKDKIQEKTLQYIKSIMEVMYWKVSELEERVRRLEITKVDK